MNWFVIGISVAVVYTVIKLMMGTTYVQTKCEHGETKVIGERIVCTSCGRLA